MSEVSEAAAETQTRSSLPLMTRLSVMMFLQYFIQGSYLPIASVYVEKTLGFSSRQVGAFGAALAVGPILATLAVLAWHHRRLAVPVPADRRPDGHRRGTLSFAWRARGHGIRDPQIRGRSTGL